VPVHVRSEGRTTVERVPLDDARRTVTLPAAARCVELAIDPDFRLARRLGAGEAPPVLREATLDDALGLTVLPGDERLPAAARALAGSWLDRTPGDVAASAAPGRSARLVIGNMTAIDAWLAQHGLPARTLDGDVVAWALRAPAGGTLALVAARDADALVHASRSLPHYGAQGWVTVAQGRTTARGQWPATTEWRKVCAH
jgi:aminopeptidase N